MVAAPTVNEIVKINTQKKEAETKKTKDPSSLYFPPIDLSKMQWTLEQQFQKEKEQRMLRDSDYIVENLQDILDFNVDHFQKILEEVD